MSSTKSSGESQPANSRLLAVAAGASLERTTSAHSGAHAAHENEGRVAIFEQDASQRREEIGVQLEDRMRAQIERASFRQREVAPRFFDGARAGTAIVRIRHGSRQLDEALRVLIGGVAGLAMLVRNVAVDRRNAGRDRMSPGCELDRREASERQQVRKRVHSDVREHEDIEPLLRNQRPACLERRRKRHHRARPCDRSNPVPNRQARAV